MLAAIFANIFFAVIASRRRTDVGVILAKLQTLPQSILIAESWGYSLGKRGGSLKLVLRILHNKHQTPNPFAFSLFPFYISRLTFHF